MSRPALLISALIVLLTVSLAVAALESDALGALAAVIYVAAAVVLLFAVWLADALVRSSRKARAAERFAKHS